MAARTRKLSIDDRTKLRIKTSQIINRLQDHVFGEVELVATQVTAGLALLRKTIPDLSATTHEGNPDKPIETNLSITFRRPE